MMDIRFGGRKALVTGAGKGIGRAIVKKLVECGAETVALSRTQADLESLKLEVPSIRTVQCDLADWEGTRKAVAEIGPIDLLVNNAGIVIGPEFLDIKKEDIYKSFDVNVFAAYNVTQIVVKGMIERNEGGAIVNVSAVGSKSQFPGNTIYGATKAALDSFTRSLAVDLGKHKIRCNSVQPTAVWTDMYRHYYESQNQTYRENFLGRHPLGQLPAIEDVVNAVLFLLSDKAAMINGTELPVDGGILVNLYSSNN